MKILFVYGNLVVQKTPNAYHHNFLQDIINRYSQFGQLTICTSCKSCQSSQNRILDMRNVRFRPIDKENTLIKRFFNHNNKKILYEEVQKSDFVIIHVPSSESNLAAKYARMLKKAYLCVVVGCVWDSLWNYNVKGKLLAPLDFYLMKKTVAKANYALYVTNTFLQHRYPCKNFNIGCSDVSISRLNEESLIHRIERITTWDKSSIRNVVSIGGLDVVFKGQQYIIKAIAKLNIDLGFNYHCYFIGAGDGLALKKLSTKLHVEKYIHFLGSVNHDEIFNIFNKMDIYILASKQEGLPRALVEAMSVGMPALASNIAGCPELLNSDFLFPKGNVECLVDLLLKNNDEWINAAKLNIIKAKDYLEDSLTCRRNDFFSKIFREIKNN